MAKGKFVQTLIDTAVKAGKLDMSDASRLSRAADMGFDTSKKYYHGTDSSSIAALRSGDEYQSNTIFLTPRKDMASEYAEMAENPGVMEVVVKPDAIGIDFDLPGQRVLSIDDARAYSGREDWSVEDFIEAGYSIGVKPSDARFLDAAFDPSKKDSSNLMASLSALGGAGLAGASALTPKEAMANDMQQHGSGYAKKAIQDSLKYGKGFAYRQSYDVPENQMYADLAEKAGKYNQWRKDNVHPVADFALPVGELPEDLLRKAAYGDKIRYMDVLMAELGLL